MYYEMNPLCDQQQTRIFSNAEETRFTALADDANAAYAVRFTLDAPIADTYIMIPACAYDGNRFTAVTRRYPPMFNEDEFDVNPPVRMTGVPQLLPEGDSFMDVTTGDMAAPCVCVLNKALKKAFMVFFNQAVGTLNLGVTLEQTGDTLAVILRAPAKRRLVYRWYDGIPSLRENPEADPPLSVKAGDTAIIEHRVFVFDCEDIPALYAEFFRKRADLYTAGAHASLPFSAFYDMAAARLNTVHYNDKFGFIMSSASDSGNTSQFSQWQAGWVGGGMDTMPLLASGDEDSLHHAINTLLFAARYQSPIGFYYGIVCNGEIHHDCFNYYEGKYNLLLIRKHADLTFFMFRQIALMNARGIPVPAMIRESAIKAADALVTLWQRYGQLGQFINCETGEIVIGGTASGGMAPAALCAAYSITGDERYLTAARGIADYYYQNFTRAGLTNGGPGEILQAPDSESAAGLLESYSALYEIDGSALWLSRTLDAAHQTASWVVPYDYKFPETSRFGKMDIHAAGSVWANVQNKHSAPGLCTVSPIVFLRLYRATGDVRYLKLMSEIAHFMPQVASRPERPMGMPTGGTLMPGDMCERVNLSDWEGTSNVGDSIFGDSAWPKASLLLTTLDVPGVYVFPERGLVCVSDHVNTWLKDGSLVIENPTGYDARVKVMIETEATVSAPLGLWWHDRFATVAVGKGSRAVVPLK